MALGSRSRYQGVTAPELAVEIAVSEARKSLGRNTQLVLIFFDKDG
jgi:hypothetical protein